MAAEATYYLGRVIKLGQLNTEKLIYCLQNPGFILNRNKEWTFINVAKHEKYIVGVLAKYEPVGEINVVDKQEHSRKIQKQTDLIIAQSPFIYLPEYSGIAFQPISNHISPKAFAYIFSKIVKKSFNDFFIDCEIEMIADLRTFAIKLARFDGIFKIKAKVNPPNPLYGDLWSPLKDYLKERNAGILTIEEESANTEPLKSKLVEYVSAVVEGNQLPLNESKYSIGDAAIMMAADGYGEGIVRGYENKKIVTVKTSETIKNFSFEKTPEHDKFFDKANRAFKAINDERNLKH